MTSPVKELDLLLAVALSPTSHLLSGLEGASSGGGEPNLLYSNTGFLDDVAIASKLASSKLMPPPPQVLWKALLIAKGGGGGGVSGRGGRQVEGAELPPVLLRREWTLPLSHLHTPSPASPRGPLSP